MRARKKPATKASSQNQKWDVAAKWSAPLTTGRQGHAKWISSLFGLSFSLLKIFWSCNFCLFQWKLKWWFTTGTNIVSRPAAQTLNTCLQNIVSPFVSYCIHESQREVEANLYGFSLKKKKKNLQWINTQKKRKIINSPLAVVSTQAGTATFFLTPVFSISGPSLRLTQWDWLLRSKVSFFAPVVAFLPLSYRNPRAVDSLFSVSFHL